MNERANIYFNEIFAGILEKSDTGFSFHYDKEYLNNPTAAPISINFPLREEPYLSSAYSPSPLPSPQKGCFRSRAIMNMPAVIASEAKQSSV